jgi:pSer/pThr/pTyr-binding forkhead associated (FHA) protein
LDAFLEACGAAGPIRLEIAGARGGRRRRAIPRPFAVVGRSAGCDVRLASARVAPRHAYFQLIGGRLAVFDLGARGGLRWDDGRPARSGWLDPGRVVQIGPYQVRRLAADSAEADPTAGPPHNLRWTGGGPNVVLIFPDQATGPVRWKMTRAVTLVGRAPGCRVRLPDESVSWYHAGLVRTPAGVWLVDLHSRGGVTINGGPTRYGPVADGDEVSVGRFRMVVRYEDAPRAATATGSTLVRRPVAAPPAAAGPEPPVDLPLEPELMGMLDAARGEVAAPALMMLVEQFGRMQQQMLEQFYQSTMALVGHLDEHYRDQMRQMRDELDQLRDLSRELVDLRGQLNAAPPPPAPANGHRPAAAPLPPPAPTPARPPAARSAPRPPPPPGPPPPRPPAAKAASATTRVDDPLVLVSRRIAEIRGEQRSRWQKILDLIRPR